MDDTFTRIDFKLAVLLHRKLREASTREGEAISYAAVITDKSTSSKQPFFRHFQFRNI